MSSDFISVIEAVYAPTDSEQDWVQGIGDAVGPLLDVGMGVNVYTYDAAEPLAFKVGACASFGATPVNPGVIEAIIRAGTPSLTRLAHLPGPPMFFSQLARRLAREGIVVGGAQRKQHVEQRQAQPAQTAGV